MKNKLPFLILLLTLAAAACNQQPKDPAVQLDQLRAERDQLNAQIAELEKQVGNNGGPVQRIRTVGVSSIERDTFQHFIDLQGKVEAENNVQVTAKMPGVLTRILVKNGDQVRKGQLLAQLDNEVGQLSLKELETQLQTATDLYNRQKSLWDQKIGTEVQFIQAKSQKEALEQRLATTKEQMGQANIYAPIAGTVDMVLLKTGQAISPGVPLCNIINLGDLKITAGVPDAYVAKINRGDRVMVHFPDLNKDVISTVRYVSKTINPLDRTFTVEVALPAKNEYRSNMVAVLKVIDYQNKNAVVVPVNIIQTAEDGNTYVLALEKTEEKKGIARRVDVKQGNNYNGMVEITSGLKPGDTIISTGFQDVNAGETVSF